MGSLIEFNDTLQITQAQGFPSKLLDVRKHQRNPSVAQKLVGRIFAFRNKPVARIYHTPPTRVFLVQNVGGKWIHWGTCLIVTQTIESTRKGAFTSGKFKITQIYDAAYQREHTKHDSPKGKSWF
ncbi:MAG: hypothetical protein V1811_02515 [Candidatus Micrarchaeota archaeon]